jgi:transcriptional regulator with XRE-family HTH domain
MATKTLGQRIRELREEKDLSLRELAKKIGVSAAFLSDVELGRRYPSEKVLIGVAQHLDNTQEELRKYDTSPPVKEMRRLIVAEPLYGVAFRRVIEEKISPQELLKFAEESSKSKKKKKS